MILIKINSNYPLKKNYSFSDIIYEENESLTYTSHSEKELVVWNIDVLVEYHNYNKIGIAMMTYKMKYLPTIVTTGFISTLNDKFEGKSRLVNKDFNVYWDYENHGHYTKDNQEDTIYSLKLKKFIINILYSILNKNHTSFKINNSKHNQHNIKDNSIGNNLTYDGCKGEDCTHQNLSINVISNSKKEVFFYRFEHIKDQDCRKNIWEH